MLLVCLAGWPTMSAAQARTSKDTARVWIGIEITVVRGTRAFEIISGVHPLGPAAAAGILAGDTLLRINGVPFRPAALNRIAAGEDLVITIGRGGRIRDFRVAARPRPSKIEIALFREGAPHDSVRAFLDRSLDSSGTLIRFAEDHLRIPPPSLGTGSTANVLRLHVQGDGAFRHPWMVQPPAFGGAYGLIVVSAGPGTRLPFELFVQPGPVDSLSTRMRDLMKKVQAKREAEMERLRILLEEHRGSLATALSIKDPELLRLKRKADSLQMALERELERAREMLTRVSWKASSHRARPVVEVRGVERPLPTSTEEERVPPPILYFAGHNVLGGAAVVALNPGLAAYFGVRQGMGMLVVEVLEGTPMEEAGVSPGDVITHVGKHRSTTLRELRTGWRRSEEPIKLTVIRKKKEIELVLPPVSAKEPKRLGAGAPPREGGKR